MTKCIIGYSGFVGGNLLLQKKFDNFYNSQNINDIRNLFFDELYFCGIPAVKWYANQNPIEDTNNIENIIDILKTVKVNKFILISTIDVYENINSQDNEDYNCDYKNNHIYGKNRYIFENFIKNNYENTYIVRLPALFGYGLKKNIIYDLINNNQINKISINTKFQWYNLDWLSNDIEIMFKNNIYLCNFFTEPLETYEIIKLFNFPIILFDQKNNTEYNLKTKYHQIFNSNINDYIRTKKEVLDDIIEFINYQNLNIDNLCISNICVNNISHLQFSKILKILGFKNIEVAPTKLIEWNNLYNLNLDIYNNLNVYSFQSITFGLTELNIFNEKNEELLKHLKNVIDSAVINNVKIIVFGCPKNRYILNNNIENIDIAISFFRNLGEYCNNKNISICIEPNSKKYNCNFINTINEAHDFVEKVNNINIKLMFDLGNAIMDNLQIEDFILFKNKIHHVHISQEYMDNFEFPNSDNKKFKEYLKLINYNKIITLEMLIKNSELELEILIKSLKNFINLYGDEINSNRNKYHLYFKNLYI